MIHIVDDFYPKPDIIREKALGLEFVEGINDNNKRTHTGVRAKNPNYANMMYLRNRLQSITGKKIVDFKHNTSNGSFNLGWKKEHYFNWIHGDHTKERGEEYTFWAAVIYLTPNPPINSGTILVEEVETETKRQYETDAVTKGPAFKENFFDGNTTAFDQWRPHITIENKYNRCLVYQGTYFHAPTVSSFGSSKQTGRLTQVAFFETEI